MHIEPTAKFKKEFKQLAKKYPSLVNDLRKLESDLQQNPQQGEALGMNCYKIRLAIDSKVGGKADGARVVTCVRIFKDRIDLLSIYDKAEQATIKKHELKKIIKQFIKD